MFRLVFLLCLVGKKKKKWTVKVKLMYSGYDKYMRVCTHVSFSPSFSTIAHFSLYFYSSDFCLIFPTTFVCALCIIFILHEYRAKKIKQWSNSNVFGSDCVISNFDRFNSNRLATECGFFLHVCIFIIL